MVSSIKISYAPFRHVYKDLETFLDNFNGHDFNDFVELWNKENFCQILFGRSSQTGFLDLVFCIFFNTMRIFESTVNYSKKIACIYLLYAFFSQQPIEFGAQIRVTLENRKNLDSFVQDLAKSKIMQPVYIYYKLWALNAFTKVKNHNVLFPLSQLSIDPDDELYKYNFNLSSNQFVSEFNDQVIRNAFEIQSCVIPGVENYLNIKRNLEECQKMGKNQSESEAGEGETNPFADSDSDEDQEFQPSFNYVNRNVLEALVDQVNGVIHRNERRFSANSSKRAEKFNTK